jgi:hypothetical protein
MKQYKVPTAGNTISVTTRYRNLYRYSDAKYDEFTYSDVEVLPPFDWMKAGEFRVKDVRKMGNGHVELDRIIAMNHVIVLSGEDVEELGDDVDLSSRLVPIQSARTDEIYSVTVERGVATKCTCKGFQFRGRCSHLKTALEA